ncbi:ATP-binding protein [Miltoncostaea marina]|uniref:ATP-binding protein n=1 Tax=Miltoncostaea marina TaxID=2843215 RepID=UPI001C3E25F2|nr:ATP-binding protein [Miltoncostaea marina]
MGAQVTVALNPDLAGVAPIYRGRLQPIGQIGSLVRIPQGLIDLVATVTLLGISELAGAPAPADAVQTGERWLQVQLLGEIDHGTKRFQRGVGSYPGLDDPVHFATAADLASVFPPPGNDHLRLGRLSAADDVPVALDIGRFVVRHAAVVGSTGSGKTSAVASLLQGLAREGWKAANIVVIDPHGEYSRALESHANVRSVLGSGTGRLRVPYWALPASDVLRVFTGSAGGGTAGRRFAELVADERRRFVEAAQWLNLSPAAVTADTPVPFDVGRVWHRLDWENREVRDVKNDPATVRLVDAGDPEALTPAEFVPYGPAGQAPHQSPIYGTFGNTPELLRFGLRDPRLSFLREPRGDVEGPDPLVATMHEWLGGLHPVSVLDFSGVPDEASELAIGVVLHLLFEVAVRTPPAGPGLGRPLPVLIVLEEAHRYLSDEAAAMAKESANRIAREGRKYGVGLLLVTQRPSELPDTALAQCGTLLALRLTNSADQSKIQHALPDSVAGLAAALPALRTGEAVVSGEAVVLPARMVVDCPNPLPLAEDPPLTPWRQEPSLPDLAPALAAWRGTYEVNNGP